MVEYDYSGLPRKNDKSTIPQYEESAFKGDDKETTAEYVPAIGQVDITEYN